jgi:L-fuculose-phosphate aldolase
VDEVTLHINEAVKYGKKMFERGLIDGASGNMSFRVGNRVFITKTGVNLDELDSDSFVEVPADSNLKILKERKASSDSLLHLKCYHKSTFKTIIHCHGIYNVVLSLKKDSFEPLDLEGSLFLGKIEFVEGIFMTQEFAEEVSEKLSSKGFAVVKGHGIYTAANSFRQAFNIANYIEHSCQIAYLHDLLKD